MDTVSASFFSLSVKSLSVRNGEFAGTTITAGSEVSRAMGVTEASVRGDPPVTMAAIIVWPMTMREPASPLARANLASPTVPSPPPRLVSRMGPATSFSVRSACSIARAI